jgi:hypothetical protein
MNTKAVIRGSCHCGAVIWDFAGMPADVTVCNCTLCRRTGAVWAYGYADEDIVVRSAPEAEGVYVQGDRMLGVHFCRHCGNVSHWLSLEPESDGRLRMAVNLRLAEPGQVRPIPLKRFDGFDTWTSTPAEGRCMADLWF